MNAKFAGLFKLLIIATTLSATAGCASVQDAFAPGIVAHAKSAGSEAIAADNSALVPGSVDLSISENGPRPAYSGSLVPGSVDLSTSSDRVALVGSGALVSATAYMPRFRR